MKLFARTLLFCGPPAQLAEASEAHELQLQQLQSEGKLHLAGRFDSGEGLFEVLRVADRHEAERWTRESALVEGGLVSWTLRPWTDRVEST